MKTNMSQVNFSNTVKIYSSDSDWPDNDWTLIYEGPIHHRMKVIAPVPNGKIPFQCDSLDNQTIYHELEIIDGDLGSARPMSVCKVQKLSKTPRGKHRGIRRGATRIGHVHA